MSVVSIPKWPHPHLYSFGCPACSFQKENFTYYAHTSNRNVQVNAWHEDPKVPAVTWQVPKKKPSWILKAERRTSAFIWGLCCLFFITLLAKVYTETHFTRADVYCCFIGKCKMYLGFHSFCHAFIEGHFLSLKHYLGDKHMALLSSLKVIFYPASVREFFAACL